MNLRDEVVYQMARSLTEQLAEQQEAAIRKSISAYLENDDWKPEDLIGRAEWIFQDGVPGKKLMFDGRVLMHVFDPITSCEKEGDSYIMRTVQQYRAAS